jgi:hypothetical protein
VASDGPGHRTCAGVHPVDDNSVRRAGGTRGVLVAGNMFELTRAASVHAVATGSGAGAGLGTMGDGPS